MARRAAGGGGGAARQEVDRPAGGTLRPASLADIRKQRARQESLGDWTRVGLGALATALGVVLLATVSRPQRPEEHPHYGEALRVLRNDRLEDSEQNVRFALRLIDAATKPYSDSRFRTVDPQEWPPQCAAKRRICRQRPEAESVKGDAAGWRMPLLPLESGDARVWLIEELISEEDAALLLASVGRANFSTSATKLSEGQEWRSSSSTILPSDEPATRRVLQRAAALCGVPPNFVERPQAVRYFPGERYQPHLDSDGPEHRHWTLLLYLNDPGGGGATGFPLLGLKVLPAPRAALLWENLRLVPGLAQPVRNYYTLHDGQAPTGQEPKYAINIWVRNMEYTLKD